MKTATATGVDYKLFVRRHRKRDAYLLAIYSSWVDKPGSATAARQTAYSRLATLRHDYPKDTFWLDVETRYTPGLPEHTKPHDEIAVCWLFDVKKHGLETANRMHPVLD